ncbi:MAG TPA: 2'-5' RNA ligase family protein [Polyangiaceae bacterium]|nr:2'-5' RNA ligase family protein [Polyangiaceae bacterium]
MTRPNFFLAFPMNGEFVLGLPELPTHFRRFHPDDVHATLAFLGPCGEDAATRAFGALREELGRAPRPPIDVTLAEVVPMGGSKRRYTALSALLGRGREETAAFVGELRDPLLRAAGARPDPRVPKPHVTIARPRTRAKDEDRARGLEWANGVDLRGVSGRLDRVALYTWNEPRVDRFFRVLSEVPLAPITASS